MKLFDHCVFGQFARFSDFSRLSWQSLRLRLLCQRALYRANYLRRAQPICRREVKPIDFYPLSVPPLYKLGHGSAL
nr:MAG TPA: hypothetical protein [Caudoviricetes sp.]